MTDVAGSDDLPHPDAAVELWQFEAWCSEENLAIWVEFGWHRASRRAWYAAVLTPPDGPVTLVVDPDVVLNALTRSLEFRAEGIWAQHVCERPVAHWTVGLEAFGVHLDDPADAAGEQWGTRAAVGLDLEWEADDAPRPGEAGFTVPSAVHGEVLIDDRVVDFDGTGLRGRWWGDPDPSVHSGPGNDAPAHLSIPLRIARPSGDRIVSLSLMADGRWSWRPGGDPAPGRS